jgi:signal transduction histidine kinase
VKPSRRRRPRLRSQLMMLFAGPFFFVGAVLLTVPTFGVSDSVPAGTHPTPQPEVSSFPYLRWSLSLGALLLVSLLLGWVVAGRLLRPLRAITSTARDISATSLHRRLGPTGRTAEFAELAETLDGLFARLEAAFASQRRFVAHASHELRTPLTAQRALLQVALADPDATADSLRAACRDVLAVGASQEQLIEALLTLASGEQGVERREPLDLAWVAGQVLADQRSGDLTIETELQPAAASGDVRLVESLVANLVDNAVRYNTPGGWVSVATGLIGGQASIAVRNSGPVVPAAELDRLFEPFQQISGRPTGNGPGHGLGLAIVRAIADAHDAVLMARPREGGGLDVVVRFPPAG